MEGERQTEEARLEESQEEAPAVAVASQRVQDHQGLVRALH